MLNRRRLLAAVGAFFAPAVAKAAMQVDPLPRPVYGLKQGDHYFLVGTPNETFTRQ